MLIPILVFGISSDCPDVINLAVGLNLDQTEPIVFTALQTDCCSGTGYQIPFVECVNQRVNKVNWYNVGLNGTLNGTALPNAIQYLDLHSNQITGEIPTSFPTGLQYLSISGNQMFQCCLLP